MRLLLVPCLAAALLLSGCTGAPTGHASDPDSTDPVSATPTVTGRPLVSALAGGFWAVEDAAAEPAGTRLRVGSVAATVFRPAGRIDFGLAAQGDHLLATRFGWSASLGDDSHAPWLDAADRIEREGERWHLLDIDGRTVALLERSDAPPPSTQYETDPTESVTEADRLRDAVPGEGAHQQTASALQGRWYLPGYDDVSVTFDADGQWIARTTCESGTGAAGGGGGYRVLDGGLLLVTEGPVAAVGCFEPTAPPSADADAITRVAAARSFRVQNERLTLFDRDGKALGRLIR